MPFLPYCDEWDWACMRGLSLGMFAVATIVVCVYVLSKIVPVMVRTCWYRVNCIMLSLVMVQMIALAAQSLIVRSAKLLFLTKYLRGLQISMTCLLYGKIASRAVDRKVFVKTCLFHTVAAVVILMTVNLIVMVDSPEIDCRHTSWLVMSISGAVLAGSFAVTGKYVLGEVRVVKGPKQHHSNLLGSSDPKEVQQSHKQLWILLLFNTGSAFFQLLLDLYITYFVVANRSCDAMFFADENVEFEQSFRLFLALIGYYLPEWATIYVFYYIPRHQFCTSMDIPDLNFHEGEEQYYRLLEHRGISATSEGGGV